MKNNGKCVDKFYVTMHNTESCNNKASEMKKKKSAQKKKGFARLRRNIVIKNFEGFCEFISQS